MAESARNHVSVPSEFGTERRGYRLHLGLVTLMRDSTSTDAQEQYCTLLKELHIGTLVIFFPQSLCR